jgi:hypothetical protein
MKKSKSFKPNYFSLLVVVFLSCFVFSCQKDELNCDNCETNTIDFRSSSTDLYISSNNAGAIGIWEVSDVNNIDQRTINVGYSDADGIFYDEATNKIYHVDRSNNQVKAYSGVSNLMDGDSPMPSAVSTSNFTQGREMAVMGNFIIVAQDAAGSNGDQNMFVIYEITSGGIMYRKSFNATINLWGMRAVGNALYAIQDNSDFLVAYTNFLNNPDGATVMPSYKLQITGIVRTHGITYSPENDVMILTDVGSGADPADGAVHIISNFSFKAGAALRRGAMIDGVYTATLPMNQQVRIFGSNTFLGNPVDVDYNYETGEIFIAERANSGGRILVFDESTNGGNVSPIFNQLYSGASAVYLNVSDTE